MKSKAPSILSSDLVLTGSIVSDGEIQLDGQVGRERGYEQLARRQRMLMSVAESCDRLDLGRGAFYQQELLQLLQIQQKTFLKCLKAYQEGWLLRMLL